MPPPLTSFYHAIFKKLQATAHWESSLSFDGHLSKDDASPNLYGGFSLKWPGDPYGLFGSLSAAAPNVPQPGYALAAGLRPLDPASLVPADNPLYAMLAASLGPDGTLPSFVTVAGQKWPVMPPPEPGVPPALGSQTNGAWLAFNAGSPPPLVSAFGDWISAGKLDDSPKGPLLYPALMANVPAPFPGAKSPILFVASFAGDDGRRAGDGAMPAVPLGHVPGNFWDTSQVFLTDTAGNLAAPPSLPSGSEFHIAAVIGHGGVGLPGSLFGGTPLTVLCDALCFNTFMSPSVPLPALDKLDPADSDPSYEQHVMDPLTWEIAGFRFNVDSVFAGLDAALVAANVDLGGLTAAEWLKDGHPCVKVRIMSGEGPNLFSPQGPQPTLAADPRLDRHIAQHNLAPFNMALTGAKKFGWTNFIVAQAGRGANSLALQTALPNGAVRYYVAAPTRTYERYLANGHRGYEPVREGVPKPFPDAVILRRTGPEARLELAEHAREPLLGLALGLEWEPAGLTGVRLGNVSAAHARADGHVVGGFTLRPQAT